MTTHPVLRTHAITLATTLALTFGPGGLLPMGAAMAAPGQRSPSRGASVTLNFVNADIEGVARAVSAIINRQILVDPRVKGTVTLYSEQPMSPNDAYLAFLSGLRGQGFALVEVAGLLKVVPEADAKLQTGTVEVSNRGTRSGDQILTQIFRLQHESVNSMVTVLRPLISPNNTINANPSTNSLVITDYADNLKRIGLIIAAMDMPGTTELETVPLQYAVAADLAPLVQRLADGGGAPAGAPGGGGQGTVVVAESRSNSLLVRASNGSRLASVKSLISKLDRPGANGLGGSGINVVYLKNADAVKLAQILRAAFPGGGGGSASSGSSSTPASNTPTASNTNSASGTATGASVQSTSAVGASSGPSTGGYIQADPATNSLIITAPESLYRQLRAVIDQLDGRRAQLYIEAMIVEVSAEKFAQVGVQWQTALGERGDSNIVGVGSNLPAGTIPGILSGPFGKSATVAATGLATASKVSGFNIGVVRDFGNGNYGLAALASFLQTKADGNILSTPNLVVLDNEEAKIVSGQNVPFITGQFSTTTTGTASPFTTVDRKDVGLTLRVKPQIGEGGTIRLTVYQENSDVTSEGQNGPTTSKSSIETSVVVDDGTLLVLGGLIKDKTILSQSKVPLLGDVPYLGALFRSESRDRKKTNLMVFLRPVVMRNQAAASSASTARYDYMTQAIKDISPEKTLLLPIEVGQLPSLSIEQGTVVPPVSQPVPSQLGVSAQPLPPASGQPTN